MMLLKSHSRNMFLSDKQSVSLWRYLDPLGGDRKMIDLKNPLENNERIPDSGKFCFFLHHCFKWMYIFKFKF